MISMNNQDCAYIPAEGRALMMQTLMDPDAMDRVFAERAPRRPRPAVSLPSDVPCETPDASDVTEAAWWAWYGAEKAARRQNARAWACVWGVALVAMVAGVIVRLLP